MSIYKTCDIRGRFGEDLQVEHAARLGAALAALKGPGQVLVCGDGRASTPLLKSALIDSLLRSACRVVDLGQAPTPLFYFARRRLGIDLGVMVTASHNPAGDNGFKITLGPLPITPEEMGELAAIIESSALTPHPPAPSPTRGEGGQDDSALIPYPLTQTQGANTSNDHTPLPPCGGGAGGEGCLQLDLLPEYLSFLFEHTPDLTGMKVVVDCANGMAGLVARQIWAKTGAQATLLLEEVNGRFPSHAPNPAEAKNLALLQGAVREAGADLGVAYDGDADRVAFVDESGQPLVNDKAIVLFARQALHAMPGIVIYDQKCSRVVPDAIQALGGRPVMELSGHTFIKRAFLTQGAVYAGELSGHHFLRSFGGDDGFGASLVFARIIKESGLALSQLAAGIQSYPITPDIRLPLDSDAVPGLIAGLEERLGKEAQIVRTDGLRLEFPDGWGLVRPSVTEPAVTLRFEAVDEAALRRILGMVEGASPLLKGKLLSRLGD